MNKIRSYSWIVMFALVMIIPNLLWFMPAKEEENQEYRELAEKPRLSLENLFAYGNQFEAYYNDHLPERSRLIRINNKIDMKLFGETNMGDVLVGKEDWYYLKLSTEYHRGNVLFSNEQLELIASKLEAISEYQQAKGGEFVLFIAPDKECIYPEYLPDYVTISEMDRTKQLLDYLSNRNVIVVYPKDELIEYKDYNQLYAKWDTHWNSMGAYVGCREVYKALGITMPELESLDAYSKNYPGQDLLRLLNLSGYLGLEEDYDFIGYAPYAVNPTSWGPTGEPVWFVIPECEDERKALVLRDSFGLEMLRFAATPFRETCIVHREQYSPEMFRQENPDVLIYETVERELDNLLYIEIIGDINPEQ